MGETAHHLPCFKAMAVACEENFCDDYLVLRPQDASLLDLVRVLCGSGWEKRGFIECGEEKELSERRWIIFISLLVQKMLLYMRKPMALAGSVVELFLNLISSNRGFLGLLLNLLKGLRLLPSTAAPTLTLDITQFASLITNHLLSCASKTTSVQRLAWNLSFLMLVCLMLYINEFHHEYKS